MAWLFVFFFSPFTMWVTSGLSYITEDLLQNLIPASSAVRLECSMTWAPPGAHLLLLHLSFPPHSRVVHVSLPVRIIVWLPFRKKPKTKHPDGKKKKKTLKKKQLNNVNLQQKYLKQKVVFWGGGAPGSECSESQQRKHSVPSGQTLEEAESQPPRSCSSLNLSLCSKQRRSMIGQRLLWGR